LFDLLPAGFSSSNCSVPSDGGVPDSTVTIDCTQATTPNGPTSATFALFPNQRSLDKHFQGFVGEDKVLDCPGGFKSPGTWNYNDTPDVAAGRIACGTFQGTPDVIWTQNADMLLGNIQGNDLESLYNYWANPSGNALAAPNRHG
jgi:serine/threonine-protein kinase